MEIEELEAEALKLNAESRAKLAEKLWESLELSDDENTRLWAEEALRRNAEMDADPESGIPAEVVFGENWSTIK
jgi:putative addiction module component (TIGR02574 family)